MHPIPRRRFVKGLFLGTAFSSIVGKSWSSIYAATSTPGVDAGVFEIKVSDYPALLGEIGSVRLGVSPVVSQFPASKYYPVIINRNSEGFYVLNSECKHANCVVAPFDTGNFGMRCPCHQSLYDIRGMPLEGPMGAPPETIDPLDSYSFEFDGVDKLKVFVPTMAFNVRAFLPGARINLEFVAEGGVTYEVRFREKLVDPWQRVMFSRTPDGPADEELLVGDGDPNTVYLDRTTPTGFYAISMVLTEV